MKELKIVEYCGKRVLTTAQTAEFLETKTDFITHNFSRNKEYYVLGEDYFLLEGKELKDFVHATMAGANLSKIRSLYLWTEFGVMLHVKSIDAASACVDCQCRPGAGQ